MIISKIKSIFKKLAQQKPSGHLVVKYPFEHSNEVYDVKFKINNAIEKFRLSDWGGEKEYVTRMISELREDDIFFDIGSSVGLISVIAANVVKKGKVISFEPDPENAKALLHNYEINGLKNFSIQAMAVGDEKSSMKLYTAGSNAFSPSLQQVNGIERFIEVEVNTIDNLLGDGKIPYPTVVKIDIEGAEMMALKGMKELLSGSYRPRLLFIEIHPDFLPSFQTSAGEIFSFLSELSYTMVEKIERDKQILCKLHKTDKD